MRLTAQTLVIPGPEGGSNVQETDERVDRISTEENDKDEIGKGSVDGNGNHAPKKDTEHFVVEFPGYIKNESRALETFGGLQGLSEQLKESEKNIDIRLRPKDAYCHPIQSDDSRNTTLLVLKLKRPSIAENQAHNDVSKGLMSEVLAEVVAVAQKLYSFSTPADMQYVGRDRRSTPGHLLQKEEYQMANPPGLPAVPLLCSAPRNLLEPPLEYGFKQYKAFEHGLSGLGPKPWRSSTVSIDFFSETVPEAVDLAGDVGSMILGVSKELSLSDVMEMLKILNRIFVERAIYLENALFPLFLENIQKSSGLSHIKEIPGKEKVAGLKIGTEHDILKMRFSKILNQLLQIICYKFKNGPWKGAWVKRGYDPRKDHSAAKLQVLEYCLPSNWYKRISRWQRASKEKSEAKDYLQAVFNPKNDAYATLESSLNQSSALETAGNERSRPQIATDYHSVCHFYGIPKSSSYFLQLCDVKDSFIENILKDDDSIDAKLSEASGWMKLSVWQSIKNHIVSRFSSILEQSTKHLDKKEDGDSLVVKSDDKGNVKGKSKRIESVENVSITCDFLPSSVVEQIESMVLGEKSASMREARSRSSTRTTQDRASVEKDSLSLPFEAILSSSASSESNEEENIDSDEYRDEDEDNDE